VQICGAEKRGRRSPPSVGAEKAPRRRVWLVLIAFRRVLARGAAVCGAEVFDDFIGLAFQRGIGATRPAGGVYRSVGRTCDGHAVVGRLWPRTTVRD